MAFFPRCLEMNRREGRKAWVTEDQVDRVTEGQCAYVFASGNLLHWQVGPCLAGGLHFSRGQHGAPKCGSILPGPLPPRLLPSWRAPELGTFQGHQVTCVSALGGSQICLSLARIGLIQMFFKQEKERREAAGQGSDKTAVSLPNS